jgi:hypothetical protein
VANVRSPDTDRFPHFHEAQQRMLVVDQEAGQTIFVPSGWYHQVENLTDCISINHNWSVPPTIPFKLTLQCRCNSTNICSMYSAMSDHLEDVESSLADVKELLQVRRASTWQVEFVVCCQDVLRQDAGWEWVFRGVRPAVAHCLASWMTFWRMVLHELRVRSSWLVCSKTHAKAAASGS